MIEQKPESFSIPNEDIFGANFGRPSEAALARRQARAQARLEADDKARSDDEHAHYAHYKNAYAKAYGDNAKSFKALRLVVVPGAPPLLDLPAWLAAGKPIPEPTI